MAVKCFKKVFIKKKLQFQTLFLNFDKNLFHFFIKKKDKL